MSDGSEPWLGKEISRLVPRRRIDAMRDYARGSVPKRCSCAETTVAMAVLHSPLMIPKIVKQLITLL